MTTISKATGKIPRLPTLFTTQSRRDKTSVSDLESLIRNRCLSQTIDLHEAVGFFNSLVGIQPLPEMWSFNHLFGSIRRMGNYSVVVSMYKALTFRVDFRPEITTLNSVIRCYCGLHRVDLGFSVLASAVKLGLEPNAHTLNIMLHELCSQGSTVAATKLFDEIAEKEYPGLDHSRAIFINGLCKSGQTWRALDFLKKTCGDDRTVKPSPGCFCPIIDSFFKKGLAGEAMGLYDVMTVLDVHPDIATCNTLIRGMCAHGRWREAKNFFAEMPSKHNISPNSRTYNILLHGLCESSRAKEASSLLSSMISRGIKPDVVTFNSLLSGMSKSGRWGKVSEFSRAMGDLGISPDSSTFAPVVDALCKEGRLAEAFDVVREMARGGVEPGVVVYNSLMYGLCQLGRWREGERLLGRMGERGVEPNVVTFTILADALAKRGQLNGALQVLKDMVTRGVKPDDRARKVLKRVVARIRRSVLVGR